MCVFSTLKLNIIL